MPTVVMNTESGKIGLPPGTKEGGTRIDFNPDDYAVVIETKGYRLAWSRAMLCPCKPVNDQTEQPDPNCTQCRGSGWFYFAPALATVDKLKVGELDDLQKRIVNDAGAVILGILTGITAKNEPYGEIGKRLTGVMQVTVRAENKLGYHDRLINLDSVIVFSQVLDPVTDLTKPLETRYPIVQVNQIRTKDRTFTAPGDFTLVDGRIVWTLASLNLPRPTEYLGIHYLCHPTWLVVEHPHSLRMTPIAMKVPLPRPTPAGRYIDLPVQATVQYEFLPEIR